MKTLVRIGVFCLWMVAATGALAAWWLRNPDQLRFINLPEPAWQYLLDLFRVSCCERAADVELGVALFLSFLAAAFVTFVGWQLFRRVRRRRMG